MIQAHVIYSGKVQGVGFRYITHRFASELGLVGWIRNLRDGTVEMVVEGRKETVNALLSKTDDYFNGYIRSKDLKFRDSEDSFHNFQITYE